MAKYDVLKLDNQICFPLYAAAREVVKQYHPYLTALGLTYTQYIAMMVFWEKGSISVRDLGKKLFLDSGTLTPVLKRMDNAGLITRERAAEDERMLKISITEKGRKLREKAVLIPPAVSECMGLTQKEFETLYLLTYKALTNMESR